MNKSFFLTRGEMMVRVFLILLVAAFLGGCASIRGSATQFHALDSTPKTFVIVPDRDQSDSLEFRSYAGLVKTALEARGWKENMTSDADVAVFFHYNINQGQPITYSYPILGQVPTGRSTTTGMVTSYGNTSTITATTTQQATIGTVGTGVGTYTEYERSLRVLMFSLPVYRATNRTERVYEGEIRSSGGSGDLATVMPALVRGLLDDFPGESGKTRKVRVSVK